MPKIYLPDGSEVSPDGAANAVATGDARFDVNAEYVFRKGDQRVNVPGDKAWEMIQQGYAPESDMETRVTDLKERGATGDKIKAVVGGLVSSATFGLSDVFATDEDKAERLAYAEALPGYRMAGEIGGIIGPQLGAAAARGVAKGATSAFGKSTARGTGQLLGLTPTALVGTKSTQWGEAVARWAGGGLKGRAAGAAGAAAAEGAAIGFGQELSRQALENNGYDLSKMAAGAGQDALLGLGLGAVLGAGGHIISKSGERLRKKAWGDTTIPDLNASQVHALKSIGLTADDVRSVGIKKAKGLANHMLAEPDTFLKYTDTPAERSAKLVGAGDIVGKKLGTEWHNMGPMMIHDVASINTRMLSAVSKDLVDGGSAAREAIRLLRDWMPQFGGKLKRSGSTLALKSVKPKTWGEIHEKVSNLSNEVSLPHGTAAEKQRQLIAIKLRDAVKDELETLAAKRQPDAFARIAELNKQYSYFRDISQLATKRAERGQLISSGPQAWEAALIGTSVFSGNLTGAALGAGRWAWRMNQTDLGVQAVKARWGQAAMDTLQKVNNTTFASVAKAAGSGVKEATRRLPTRMAALATDYESKTKELNTLNVTPDKIAERLGPSLEVAAQINPDLARASVKLAAEDLRWILSHMPKNVDMPKLSKKNRAMDVPPSQAASFVRRTDALSDPMREIAKIGSGKLPPAPEARQVLMERRPALLDTLTNTYDDKVEQLALAGKLLPYPIRIQASQLTGKAYDFTMNPAYVAYVQTIYAKKRALAEEVAGGGQPGPKTRRTPDSVRDRSADLLTGAQENMQERE